MTLLDDIKNCLSGVSPGTSMALKSLPESFPGWITRASKQVFSAVIPVPDSLVFDEAFSAIQLYTANRNFKEHTGNFLHLECAKYSDRVPFEPVCLEFFKPESRETLTHDPAKWTRRWAEMLGNALRDQNPYPVIAELVVCQKLRAAGVEAIWAGPDASSHDIQTPLFDVEVKSTIRRYGNRVTINGQHQLTSHLDGSLYLAFVRFEEHPGGHTINSVASDLVSSGVTEAEVESKLEQMGYPVGRPSRQVAFAILEANVYMVNDSFPSLTIENFVGGILPPGVIRFEYEVDLIGLPSTSLDDFIARNGGSP